MSTFQNENIHFIFFFPLPLSLSLGSHHYSYIHFPSPRRKERLVAKGDVYLKSTWRGREPHVYTRSCEELRDPARKKQRSCIVTTTFMLQHKEMLGCDKSSCCWLKINPRDQRLWNYFDGQLNDLIHEDWQETGTGISPKTCVNTEEENLMIKVKESGDTLPEQRIVSQLVLDLFFFFFLVLILNFCLSLGPETNEGVALCEAERTVDRTQPSPTVSRFNNCHTL